LPRVGYAARLRRKAGAHRAFNESCPRRRERPLKRKFILRFFGIAE
jgi:uncharacterized membrane protein